MNCPECPRHFEIIKESKSYITVEKSNHRGIWQLDIPIFFWARFVKDKEWQSHMEGKYSVLISRAKPSKPLPKWWPKTKPTSMSKSGIIPIEEPTARSFYWNLPAGWSKDKESSSFVTLSQRAWEYEKIGAGVIELNIPSSLWNRFCKDKRWREEMANKHAKLRYLRKGGDDGIDLPTPAPHMNRIGSIPLDEPFAFSRNRNCPKGLKKIKENDQFICLTYVTKTLNTTERKVVESKKLIYVPVFIWERFTQDGYFRSLILDTFSCDYIEQEDVKKEPNIEDYNIVIENPKFNSFYWHCPPSHKIIQETSSSVLVNYYFYNIGSSGFQEIFSEHELAVPAHHWDRYCSDERWRMDAIKKYAKLIKLNVPKEKLWQAMQESNGSGIIPNNPDIEDNSNWTSITFS